MGEAATNIQTRTDGVWAVISQKLIDPTDGRTEEGGSEKGRNTSPTRHAASCLLDATSVAFFRSQPLPRLEGLWSYTAFVWSVVRRTEAGQGRRRLPRLGL